MRWNVRFGLMLTLTSSVLAFWLGSARAAGIPETGTLVYAGVLQEGTEFPSGSRPIAVELYDASAGGDLLCRVDSGGDVPVTSGRFRIDLGGDPDCLRAVRANREVWVSVEVNGRPLGRSKIAAVPYAVEAARSSSAAGALGDLLASLVPPKTIVSAYLSAREVADNFTPQGLGRVPGPYAGWAICNGSNGTPNLSGRFVRASAVAAGATGGSDTIAAHAHGIDHDHGSFASAAESGHTHSTPNHGHTLPLGWDGTNFFYGMLGGEPLYGSAVINVSRYTPGFGAVASGAARLAFTAQGGAGNTGPSSGHGHAIDPPGFGGMSGAGGAGDNRPAFTELVALMRL